MNQEEYLSEISNRIAEILGLHFQANQLKDMERRILAAATDLKIETDINNLYQWFSKSEFSNKELHILSSHLTIGETYFFREKPSLDLFIEKIIPELLETKRNTKHIKIWSAGCSSGEEPYTIAMLIKQYFPELTDWNIEILATDISQVAIQKALSGEYTDWSFRDTESAVKNKYFTYSGKKWIIDPDIKKMVTFSYLNLSKNSYPSSLTNTEGIDIIFCRNVMMYFRPQIIKEVSARFKDSLIENGWLITSQVELNDEYFSNFKRVNYRNGIFYQKTSKPNEPVKISIPDIIHSKPVSYKKREILKAEILKRTGRIEKTIPENRLQEKITAQETDYDVLFHSGKYFQCIESCLHSISLGKLNNTIFSYLVKSYANSGLLSDGINVIAKIIDTHPATPEMYYIYANLLNEQNNTEQTELSLKKAIYLNHKHVLSHLMLGNVFKKNGKSNLAIKHFETTIGLLNEYHENEIVPESEGMTAGRIKELTEQMINRF